MKQLSKLGNGIPLYRPDTVQIGDIGFIDPKSGIFQRVYNIANPLQSDDDPGCPPPIQLEKASYREDCDLYYVCYLSCFIRRTLPDFEVILAEEIK